MCITKIELPHTGKSNVIIATNGEHAVVAGTRQVSLIIPLCESHFADAAKDTPTKQLVIEFTSNGPDGMKVFMSVGPWTGIPEDKPLQQIGPRESVAIDLLINSNALFITGHNHRATDSLRLLVASLVRRPS